MKKFLLQSMRCPDGDNVSCSHVRARSKLKDSKSGKIGAIAFAVMLIGGLIYIGVKLSADLSVVHSPSIFPYLLLGLALIIALGSSL